ncbi:hypothetical protein BST81_25215 [Leptolyngbya sp. 'hensonii']|uniref:hypothetical protein n=1 Tax=Leptolyngbya sp. 'hensonii' TaxID=1922337 RepID=UPI0009502632|nr:hypothetical protein [Leptolyngbya sp. 'hensonii']OLP15655.1 hypothetical protein BST81_25215 [Leptolyngbya sp. 'hensonii']
MFLKPLGLPIITLIIGATLTVSCQQTPQNQLLGEWTGSDSSNRPVSMTFTSSNTIQIKVGEESGDGTYTTDLNQKPAHLTIDLGNRGKVETIFEITQDGKLRIENNNPGKSRPETFTGRSVLFSRPK